MHDSLQTIQQYWFIFQNEHLLLWRENNTLPSSMDHAPINAPLLRHFKLGCLNHLQYHGVEIEPNIAISEDLQAIPLRQALSLLRHDEYAWAVKAWSIILWDKNHQFCGRCGVKTSHQSTAFERQCPACHLSFFPRISPSIIVRIQKDDQILMARSPHFPPGAYGLIAGFVDVGESIEEAVHREVMEEVGLTIKNLSYWGSQPWPFPDSLMLAFTADYASGQIVIDHKEIEEAGWYTRDHLPGLPSTKLSIATQLIDEFLSNPYSVGR